MSDRTIKERIEAAGNTQGADLMTYTLGSIKEVIKVITELEERIKKLEERNPPLEITDDRIKEMFERAEKGECSCGCHVSKDKKDFKDGCDICKDNH